MPISKSKGFSAACVTDPISAGKQIIAGGEDTVLIGSDPTPIACKDCKAKDMLSKGSAVNVQLGCKFLSEEIDFALPAPLPFAWQRFYASDTPFTGVLGQGWRTPLELSVEAGETATRLIDIQGRWIDFAPLACGEEQHSPSESFWLARGTADTRIPWEERWQWLPEQYRHTPGLIIATPGDGTYLIFQPAIQPVATKDNPAPLSIGRFDLCRTISRHGYATRFEWVNIRNAKGQPVRVCEWITDSAGRIYRLHYTVLPEEDERCWSMHHPDTDCGLRLKGIALAYDPLRDPDAPRDKSALRDQVAHEWLAQYRYSREGDLCEVLDGDGDNVRTFEYERHLMTRQQSPSGLDVAYQYDQLTPEGKVVRQTSAGGLTFDFLYRADSTVVTDSLRRTTAYHFEGQDGLRRLVKLEHPDGSIVKMDYTRNGQLSTLIDPLGRKTTCMYNSLGEQTGVSTPLGQRNERCIDRGTGFVTSIRDADNGSTCFERDAQGNITEVKKVKLAGTCGRVTRYEYGHPQFPDRPTSIIDAEGGRKQFTYDSLGQLHTYIDCAGHTTTWQRDRKGQLIAIEQADGKRQTCRRDSKGRMTTIELPEGETEAFEYDNAGRLVKARDAEGRSVEMDYDRFGRMLEHRVWTGEGAPDNSNGPGWSRTRQSYDEAGRMILLTDAAGAVMAFSYDMMDRLTSETGFDGKRSQYQYNLAGEMTAFIEDAGKPEAFTIMHERDAGGRLTAMHLPPCGNRHAETHRFAYNKLNQITCATTTDSRVDFLYDDFNRLVAETQSAADGSSFTLRHGYDSLGNRIQTILPDGQTIDILRCGSGHWHQVAFNGNALVEVERDSLHHETSRTFGSGAAAAVEHPLVRHQRYTGSGQLDSAAFSRGGQVFEHWQHHYSSTGLLSGIDQEWAKLKKRIRYRYDAQERLTGWEALEAPYSPSASSPNAEALAFTRTHAETYAYDRAGNPILPGTVIRTDPVSNMPVYTSPEQWAGIAQANAGNPDFNLLGETPIRANRIAQLGNAFHEYDERGNVVKRRTPDGAWDLTWNALNQLTGSRFTPTGEQEAIYDTAYFNDAFGRRIGKTVIDLRTLTLLEDGGVDLGRTRHNPVRYVWDGNRVLQEIQCSHAATTIHEPDGFVPLAQLIQPKRQGEPPVRTSPPDEWEVRRLLELNVSLLLADPGVPEEGKRQLRAQLGQDSPYRDGDAQMHLFITDHLGTPYRMIDAATHQVLWERLQDPWGNTVSEHWHPKLENVYRPNQRMLGQQYDWETGLYYHRYRYYDPVMRRYVSQNPMGLWGGLNPYRYPTNPVQWIDPLGLKPGDIFATPDAAAVDAAIYARSMPPKVSKLGYASMAKKTLNRF